MCLSCPGVKENTTCKWDTHVSLLPEWHIFHWMIRCTIAHKCTLACSISPHKPVFNANHWHNSSGDIFVGRISTSSINSGGHPFLLSNTKRLGLKALKGIKKLIMLQQVSTETLWSCFPITHMQNLVLKGKKYHLESFTEPKMFLDERIVTLFKRNAHHTLTYWSVFFSFGLCIAFLGPTILDLQCQTNSTLSQITWVFFAQQFCLLIGSSVGGIFKRT